MYCINTFVACVNYAGSLLKLSTPPHDNALPLLVRSVCNIRCNGLQTRVQEYKMSSQTGGEGNPFHGIARWHGRWHPDAKAERSSNTQPQPLETTSTLVPDAYCYVELRILDIPTLCNFSYCSLASCKHLYIEALYTSGLCVVGRRS